MNGGDPFSLQWILGFSHMNMVRRYIQMSNTDPTTPPMFSCEKCGGQMYPEYYKGVHGIEYKLSDIL